MEKPHLLLTNDDGIDTPGIKSIWKALHNYAHLSIIAPSPKNNSARPMQIIPITWEKNTPAWSVNGSPAECIRLGLSVLLKKTPHLIISGLNRKANSGRNVLYGNTIGGVIEGALRNIPGIAFSCEDPKIIDYKNYERFIRPIIHHFIKHPLPSGSFLNVTFPKNPQKIKGFKMARQGKGYWIENPNHSMPSAHPCCFLGNRWVSHQEEEDSDVALLKKGYITAVPLQVSELTDYTSLQKHKVHLEDLFEKISNSSDFKKPQIN